MAVQMLPMVLMGLELLERESRGQRANQVELAKLEYQQNQLVAQDRHHQREVWLQDQQNAREAELRDNHSARQAAVVSQLITMQGEVMTMKVNAVMTIFQEVNGMLRDQQAILAREKEKLEDMMLTGAISGPQVVKANKRQREINRDLQEVSNTASQLAQTAMAIIQRIDPTPQNASMGQAIRQLGVL